MKVFSNRDFQNVSATLWLIRRRRRLFTKPVVKVPSPEDYRELGQKHADFESLGAVGSARAFFHVLDAEVAIAGLAEGPFLSELVGDIVEEDMADQVYRGYSHLRSQRNRMNSSSEMTASL